MSAPPRVSVCVPAYNGEPFLAACLESILAQRYTDYELLIVDDGSTDGTAAMAERYAARDARVRFVRNERNLGLVGNWARCIELARGDWLKFVFQDDLIDPGCIGALLQVADETGCPFAFCRRRYLFEAGTPEALRRFYLSHLQLTANRFPQAGLSTPADLAEMFLSEAGPDTNVIGEPIAVLFKRALVQQFGGFNPLLAVSCDSEFWQRVGVNVGVAHLPQELASFRVHRAATTSTHLRDRQFRMNTLDPVVVLHEQAFHAAFEPLRRVAQRQGKDLEAMFREKAAWAFNQARAMATEAGGALTAPLEDWHRLARHLPRLAQIESTAAARPSLAARVASRARRVLAGH